MLGRNRYRAEGRRQLLFVVLWLVACTAVCAAVGAAVGAVGMMMFPWMTLLPGMFVGLLRWSWHGEEFRLRARGVGACIGYVVVVAALWGWLFWLLSTSTAGR